MRMVEEGQGGEGRGEENMSELQALSFSFHLGPTHIQGGVGLPILRRYALLIY
jgi:hypothetical protein